MGKKDELLGISFGTASNRLRKSILFNLVRQTGQDVCFRCGRKIESETDLSIEHKVSWQSATDPIRLFFDLENIEFSHINCNYGGPSLDKTHCPYDHPYSGENLIEGNGQRTCMICKQEARRRFRANHPEQDTNAYRVAKGWRIRKRAGTVTDLRAKQR